MMLPLTTTFAQLSLETGFLVYRDAAGGVDVVKRIPLGRVDMIEAAAIATEVYPCRGRVVVHAGAVRLEVALDGEGAPDAAASFVNAVCRSLSS